MRRSLLLGPIVLISAWMSADPGTPTIALVSSANPSILGQQIALTATVSPAATGIVAFYDGVTVLGSATLSAGQASLSIISLSPGAHSLHAYYEGDAADGSRTSAPVAQTVTAIPGAGLIAANQSPLTVGTEPETMAMADFNHDGIADLAVADFAAGMVTVLLGKGDGTFTQPAGTPLPVGNGPALAVGDVDQDGNMDLVVVNSTDGTLMVWLGDGKGGFKLTNASPMKVSGSPVSVTVADFNQDGKPDLAIARYGLNSVSVFIGDGTGQFAEANGSPIAVGKSPQFVVAVDLNGDGIADLATANSGSANVTVLLGDGTGHFAAAPGNPFAVGSFPYAIAAADLNGDGKTDLAVANFLGSNVSILLGDGTGRLAAAANSPVSTGSEPYSLATGDLNGDGNPDLVVSNLGSGNLSILYGDGTGKFTPATFSPVAVGTSPEGLIVADVNGDGRADVAVANAGSNNVSILLGAPPPSLSIAKTHVGAFAAGQAAATYTITVSNAVGVGSTSGTVTVTDNVPSGETLTKLSGTNWNCPSGTNTCTLTGSLGPGASAAPITATVNVAAAATSPQVNSATVSGGGSASATVTDSTLLLPSPALSVTVTDSGNFAVNQPATYTIHVANGANLATTSGAVTLKDTLPGGFTATGLSGPGWNCILSTLTCTNAIQLAAGSAFSDISLAVNIGANALGLVTDSATVSGGGAPSATGKDTSGVTGGGFTCSGAGTPLPVRVEGITELVGDLLMQCNGGNLLTPNSQIPAVNLTVTLNAAVTSRLLSDGASEAVLLIDEPGSSNPAPVPGFGSQAPLTVCPTPLTGCPQYVSVVNGVSVATNTPGGTTPAYNAQQGIVSGNSLAFYNVPVLPPSTAGVSRIFRITNIRVNASALQGLGPTPITATLASSNPQVLPTTASPLTLGSLGSPLAPTVTPAGSMNNCSPQTKASVGVLTFTENFGSAFKTRVFAQTNTLYAGQAVPGSSPFNPQNIPGTIYNSESGFVLAAAGGSGLLGGLADFGTRIKAAFYNIPQGVTLYVSTANVTDANTPVTPPTVIGGSAPAISFAQLVAEESAGDGNGAPPVVQPTDAAGTGNVPIAPVSILNGKGTAVWEVMNANPSVPESFSFAVYQSYIAGAAPGAINVTPGFAPSGTVPALTIPSFTSPAVPQFIGGITACPIQLTFDTNPSGQPITINGVTYTAPNPITATPGSSLTITAPSLLSPSTGTQYRFGSWDNGGTQTQTITVPNVSTTYKALYNTFYNIGLGGSGSGGSVTMNSPDGYFQAGSTANILAVPAAGFQFTSFSGDVNSTANPLNIVVNQPENLIANFTSIPPGGACAVAGGSGLSDADVRALFPQVFGTSPAVSDLNHDGTVNVGDLQIGINAASGWGCTVPRFVLPACSYGLSNPNPAVSPDGSVLYDNVITGAGCNWTAINNYPSAITVNSGAGSGNGTLSLTVAPNVSIASGQSYTIRVGNTSFTISQAAVPKFPTAKAFDFAGNGFSSPLTYDRLTGWITVHLSQGDGTYTSVESFVGPRFAQPLSGDFNGDGFADILMYEPGTGTAILGFGLGDGTFTLQDLMWDPECDSVDVGDINGDGRTDFVRYSSSTGFITTAIGNGSGLFTYGSIQSQPGYTNVRLADLVDNHKDGLFAYNSASGAATMGIGDGLGGYVFHPFTLGTGYNLAAVGDLNGDGNADIVLGNSTLGLLTSGISNGIDSFTFRMFTSAPGFTDLKLGNFRGSAVADAILYNRLTTGSAFFGAGTGTGTFNFQTLPWAPGFTHILALDVNGDGKTDAVLYDKTTGAAYTGISNGDGTFHFTYQDWGPGKSLGRYF